MHLPVIQWPCWGWWSGGGGERRDGQVMTNIIVKVGQTLHIEGQYGPLGELGVLYFAHLHRHGVLLRSTT